MSGDLERSDRPAGQEPLAIRRGIDRRTLVKRAAAAGALAWSAPIIIDSLASPAAAASCGNIYRVEYWMNESCSSLAAHTPGDFSGSGDCDLITPAPSGYNVAPKNIAVSLANACISFSSSTGECDAQQPTTTTVTASVTNPCVARNLGTGNTCTGNMTVLSVGLLWRSKATGTSGTNTSFCQYKAPVGAATTVNSPACTGTLTCATAATARDGTISNQDRIISASASGASFKGVSSGKGNEASGAYQFVLGCGCS